MKKAFYYIELLSIPNLITLFRIVLIPFIIYSYIIMDNYKLSAILILISGFSDIVDGFIARKYNMVTDVGMIIDPLADKLTQISIVLCLCKRFNSMRYLLFFFILKELLMNIRALYVFNKKHIVNGAKWHGKLNTAFLYFTIIVLVLCPNMDGYFVNCLIVACIISMVISCLLYLNDDRKEIMK